MELFGNRLPGYLVSVGVYYGGPAASDFIRYRHMLLRIPFSRGIALNNIIMVDGISWVIQEATHEDAIIASSFDDDLGVCSFVYSFVTLLHLF